MIEEENIIRNAKIYKREYNISYYFVNWVIMFN
ncbi:MAG: hypothetical protein ACI93N_001341, partial [Flavobacteriaceae bacterium]